jgi:hypothetical protein
MSLRAVAHPTQLALSHATFPMSSSSVDNDSSEEEKDSADVARSDENLTEHVRNGPEPGGDRIVQLLQEERDEPPTPQQVGNRTNRYKIVQQAENGSEDGASEVLPRRPGSPPESIMSNPDNTPSAQVRS